MDELVAPMFFDMLHEIDAQRARYERLRGAAKELVTKLDECRDLLVGMAQMSAIHGFPYPKDGPEYGTAKAALEALLEEK